jgi:hypothetical protein
MFDSIVRAVSEYKYIVIAATTAALLAGYLSPQAANATVDVSVPGIDISIEDYEISIVVDGITLNIARDNIGLDGITGGFLP